MYTLAMIQSRECTKCATSKPFDEFSAAPRGRHGRKSTCKTCDAARHRDQFVPAVVDEAARAVRYTMRKVEQKACGQCGETKDISEFSKSREGKYGPVYRSNCKACASARAMQWFTANRDRADENRRRWHMVKNYGITVEEYDRLSEAQGHVCAICGGVESNSRDDKALRLSVDHCHTSGRIRGLLCNNCNRAIGLLRDNSALLLKAAEYLNRESG